MKSGMYLLPLVFSSQRLAFSLVNFSFNDSMEVFPPVNHDHLAYCSPGSWLLALGSWLLALGSWLLALGSWLLALGSWRCGRAMDDLQRTSRHLQKTRFLLTLQLIKESTQIAKAHNLFTF